MALHSEVVTQVDSRDGDYTTTVERCGDMFFMGDAALVDACQRVDQSAPMESIGVDQLDHAVAAGAVIDLASKSKK